MYVLLLQEIWNEICHVQWVQVCVFSAFPELKR